MVPIIGALNSAQLALVRYHADRVPVQSWKICCLETQLHYEPKKNYRDINLLSMHLIETKSHIVYLSSFSYYIYLHLPAITSVYLLSPPFTSIYLLH